MLWALIWLLTSCLTLSVVRPPQDSVGLYLGFAAELVFFAVISGLMHRSFKVCILVPILGPLFFMIGIGG